MKMNCDERLLNTTIYVEWFALCNISFSEFVRSIMSLIWNKFPEFTYYMPDCLIHDVPESINDYACSDRAEVVKYLNEVMNDIDFVNTALHSIPDTMKIDVDFINQLMNLPKIHTVQVICELPSNVMQRISSEWRKWYICDLSDTGGITLQRYLSSLQTELDVALVTKDYVLFRDDGVLIQYKLNEFFGSYLERS